MPRPYLTETENGIDLPFPTFLYPIAKIGLVLYAATFVGWLVHTLVTN